MSLVTSDLRIKQLGFNTAGIVKGRINELLVDLAQSPVATANKQAIGSNQPHQKVGIGKTPERVFLSGFRDGNAVRIDFAPVVECQITDVRVLSFNLATDGCQRLRIRGKVKPRAIREVVLPLCVGSEILFA